MDLLADLNPAQKKAVLHEAGPALVLAGAGSGKTRVLTTRAAYLIKNKNINPFNILLVTFTNKAAHEMNSRVEKLTGMKLPMSGTFHSLCAKILRIHGPKIGLDNNYVIYDQNDQISLIKQIYKKNNFDLKKYKPNNVLFNISSAKNELLTPSEYEQFAVGHFQEFVSKIYKLYQYYLNENNAVDFDDLLMLVNKLFREDKNTLNFYQQKLEHVLVDEYQDTNKAQYELTKFFARPDNNIFVVGDFSQSIYAWRGANYRNIFELDKDFKKLKKYKLEQNYRSTQSILDAATQVISQNNSHPVLSLWTKSHGGEKLELLEADNNNHEADLILKQISKLKNNYDYADFAILYRTNAQSRPFEEACVRWGIPYQLIGGFKFYERKEIKDLLAYLKLILNSSDSVSEERVIKIGKRRYQKFLNNKKNINLNSDPGEILKQILNIIDYKNKFDPKDPEDQERLDNIQELLDVASQFDDLSNFLENIALIQDKTMADQNYKNNINAITLMSLHSAKGLEFPVVFMVGMEEGLLPHSRSMLSQDELEEERRLCYVGITRAKEKLYFSYAKKRFGWGGGSYGTKSRFLADINPKLFNNLKFEKQNFKSNRRRLVIDDEMLNNVLSGDLDVDEFLEF